MDSQVHKSLQREFLQSALLSVLALFLVPLLTYGFVRYAQKQDDREFLQMVETRLAEQKNATHPQIQAQLEFYRQRPVSTLCDNTEPQAQEYREAVCHPYGEVWQFHIARKVSMATVGGSVLLLLAIAGLGALAFVNRRWQYRSFLIGWRLLMVASAAAVILQGAMVVWLSFWVTAFFVQKYYIKLIVVAGLLALAGVALVLGKIFQRIPSDNSVEGEVVNPSDAPLLWRRIRHMAARLKISPPDHLVAGIDANFFVTQAPLTVGNQTVAGRTLFVSIPLLRVLSLEEADAVLGHELAHFRGGDTQASADLGPKLLQYDHYLWSMREGQLTMVVVPFLQLYRAIFQLALSSDSREREFKADRTAAKLVSAQAIAQALVKIAAYASYRSNTENSLFASDQKLASELGIGARVANGLYPYARSDAFFDDMRTAQVPHPFDSHPPMSERMRRVGSTIDPEQYGAVVTQLPATTWADQIASAEGIEQRLWQAYEARFAQDHERALAYRYEPATETETQLVLKYFPPVRFALKSGAYVEINYQGIVLSDDDSTVAWDDVKALQYNDSSFGDSLTVTLNERALVGSKTTKIKLLGIGKQKEAFKAALGHYWQRHQVMRAQQASNDGA